jgi:hypothetical protein
VQSRPASGAPGGSDAPGDLPPGTLRAINRHAGLSVAEFLDLL